jgi:protein-tyrosine phosphatase
VDQPCVLFVCLGNICRSPLAEGAFRWVTAKAGHSVAVDSAGTGDWHVGHPPDRRAQAVAKRKGVDIAFLRARQVRAADFGAFSHIVAMDRTNLASLRTLRPADATADLSLLLDHVRGREGQDVADPYYGSAADFERAWANVLAGAHGLFAHIMGPV